jgi:hypothetical protein
MSLDGILARLFGILAVQGDLLTSDVRLSEPLTFA